MGQEVDIPVKVVDRRRWAHGEDAAATPGPALKPTYVEELEQRAAQAEKQAQEYLAKYRQASHEFDDARARMRKELAKEGERNRREMLVSLLEVVDNLDRAIEAAEKEKRSSDTADPLLEGVRLVRRQFLSKMDGFGVTRIDAEGVAFDPLLHEAIAAVPANDPSAAGRVVGIVRQGYRIGDEVLRPAQVAVSS
jgi:molecular chaperone GrpE